ncbi:aldo/keto reductase, partial [bacterium]|nr:aldo/keto reductase [bacterium]
LEWDEKHRIRKNCSRARILAEIDQSLRRLNTDYIDIYQVHWPDDNTSLIETMSTLSRLQKEGKIRSFGVCNYSVNRIEKIIKHYHLQSIQMPFNLLEQQNKHTLFPFCTKNNLSVLAYGTLCKGLLTGKFTHRSVFNKTDSRYSDPAFKGEQFDRNLKIVEILSSFAAQKKCSLAQLCIEWTISQPELTCALIGTRNRKQAEENFSALDNPLFSSDDFSLFERSIAHLIL